MNEIVINNSPSSINTLNELRVKYPTKVIIGHLNVNSVRNKIASISEINKNALDVMLLSETKLDESFKTAQFMLPGYQKPFRRDRSANGGGLLFYTNENLVCHQVDAGIPSDIEAIFVELNLRSQKWLIVGIYKPPSQSAKYFLESLNSVLSSLSYENIMLIGDFNLTNTNADLASFTSENGLHNLIDEPTCFKSVNNPTCIDHIWVSNKKIFMKSKPIETGISDFHKLIVTIMNTSPPPKKRSQELSNIAVTESLTLLLLNLI